MKSMNEVENIKVLIRARGGQKLDYCVLKNFKDDCLESQGQGIFMFLLGDNNIRAPSFRKEEFLDLNMDLFLTAKRDLPDETLIVNGILPNPDHPWFDQRAKNIDKQVKSLAEKYDNVETVDLKEQIFRIGGKSPRNLYMGDQTHLNQSAEKFMGPLLAAQCKAAICFQRMKMKPCHFGLFNLKPSQSPLTDPNVGYAQEPKRCWINPILNHVDPNGYRTNYPGARNVRARKVEWTPTWFPKERTYDSKSDIGQTPERRPKLRLDHPGQSGNNTYTGPKYRAYFPNY